MAARKLPLRDGKVRAYDPIWSEIRREAEAVMASEPALGSFIYATILSHDRLEDAICHRLAQRLDHSDVDAVLINQTFQAVLASAQSSAACSAPTSPPCSTAIRRAAATSSRCMYFKGFHALATHRFATRCGARAGATSLCSCRANRSRTFARRHPSCGAVRQRHHD